MQELKPRLWGQGAPHGERQRGPPSARLFLSVGNPTSSPSESGGCPELPGSGVSPVRKQRRTGVILGVAFSELVPPGGDSLPFEWGQGPQGE